MPRVCTVCSHPEREAIDRSLVNGEPFRHIATRSGTSSSALVRHKEHLPKALVKAHEVQEVAHADDLLGQVLDLRDRALRLLDTAEADGDTRTGLAGVREARACLELLGKVKGELVERHAHLHTHRSAVEDHRRFVGLATPEEGQIVRLIARRIATRGSAQEQGDDPPSLGPIAEGIREIIDPEYRKRRQAELAGELREPRSSSVTVPSGNHDGSEPGH